MSAQDVLERIGLAIPSEHTQTTHKSGAESDAIAVLRRLLDTDVLKEFHLQDAIEFVRNVPSASKIDEKLAVANDAMTTKKPEQPNRDATFPYRTRHVALRFQYDGATYSGYAQNVGSNSDESVERALFAALKKTCLIQSRDTCQYSRCGRTDRGVSAFAQVIGIQLKSAIPLHAKKMDVSEGKEVSELDLPRNSTDQVSLLVPPKLKHKKKQKDTTGDGTDTGDGVFSRKTLTELPYANMLNNVLPPTIRVLGWCPVTPEFSARFSASNRTYRYYFTQRHLNLSRMNDAIQLLVGRHDFRNLCKMDVEKVYNFERLIHSVRIMTPEGEYVNDMEVGNENLNTFRRTCYFEIVGQAFLWHQIRCIVAVLFMVGEQLELPRVITELLDINKNPGKPSYNMAPELPLVLHGCGYQNVTFGFSVKNLWAMSCDFERQWEEQSLASERILGAISSLAIEAQVTVGDINSFITLTIEQRRKKQKRLKTNPPGKQSSSTKMDANMLSDKRVIPWGEALSMIESALSIRPSPSGPKEILHVPLMERSRGTTYEEKVQSIVDSSATDGSNSRKKERYEENIIRKRKSPEEDADFYHQMVRQGGSGI